MDILFLKPVFKERIWGGQTMADVFGYDLPYEKTGECWAISGHPNGPSLITKGRFTGMTLDQVYLKHPELFNHPQNTHFPLLTKILDAQDDLSVQVHPNDDYALKHVNEPGKTECWYVLDAAPGAAIVYGHRAKDLASFQSMINKHAWDDLLIKKPVHTGDFIYVPAGTIHALSKGLLILETQQSSDTTYRLYDYDRVDADGKTRALHIDEACKVTTIPHQDPVYETKLIDIHASRLIQLIKTQHFTVEKWMVKERLSVKSYDFKLFSVIEGSGTINDEVIKKGDHFVTTADLHDLIFEGDLDMIVSWV